MSVDFVRIIRGSKKRVVNTAHLYEPDVVKVKPILLSRLSKRVRKTALFLRISRLFSLLADILAINHSITHVIIINI